jgi:hypothetical protein
LDHYAEQSQDDDGGDPRVWHVRHADRVDWRDIYGHRPDGGAGCLLPLPVHGLSTETTSMSRFSEVAFRFRITPALLAGGSMFAALMGAAGGLLPALRAARIPIARALREM